MSLRVVFDTNQIVAAGTRWLDCEPPTPDPNLSRNLLKTVLKLHKGLYCEEIADEYIEKLLDRRHPRDRIVTFMTMLEGAFDLVAITTTRVPFRPSDPDDEIFLLCALDGNADYLISDDKHLTSLRNKYMRPQISNCIQASAIFCV
jgi:predicted nucleic acid-binding protein